MTSDLDEAKRVAEQVAAESGGSGWLYCGNSKELRPVLAPEPDEGRLRREDDRGPVGP
ncbi:hypothetical protein ACFVFI_12585 [Streptomyces sp. NPDC057705]|uniref:hypothetical protein n=1 Tax=Streptomyces sp. NPDC057705 TaxID=3346222 RepID=UPI0036A9D49D